MGVNDQKYELVADGEDQKGELRPTPVIIKTPWWKIVLSNVFSAIAGALLVYLVARDTLKIHSDPAPSTSTSNLSATTTSSPIPVETAADKLLLDDTLSTDALPSPFSAEFVGDKPKAPNNMTGIILDCGGSPEEARAKGCIYDVMMQDWVPEPCYDKVLTDRYLAEGNWTWYGNWNGSIVIPNEVMVLGEHGNAWMANSYHKAHCVFSWMKIVRALRLDRPISQELLSYDHVMHCAMGALKITGDLDTIGVSAPTNYPRCALYETWLQNPVEDEHEADS